MLSREEFLRPARRRIRKSEVLDVCLRSLSEAEQAEYEGAVWYRTKAGVMEMDPDLVQGQRRLLISLCVCDEDGRRLLTSEDVDAIGELDGATMGKLVAECRRHCGMSEEDPEGGAEKKS